MELEGRGDGEGEPAEYATGLRWAETQDEGPEQKREPGIEIAEEQSDGEWEQERAHRQREQRRVQGKAAVGSHRTPDRRTRRGGGNDGQAGRGADAPDRQSEPRRQSRHRHERLGHRWRVRVEEIVGVEPVGDRGQVIG